jgi:hypothetical protein
VRFSARGRNPRATPIERYVFRRSRRGVRCTPDTTGIPACRPFDAPVCADLSVCIGVNRWLISSLWESASGHGFTPIHQSSRVCAICGKHHFPGSLCSLCVSADQRLPGSPVRPFVASLRCFLCSLEELLHVRLERLLVYPQLRHFLVLHLHKPCEFVRPAPLYRRHREYRCPVCRAA